MVVDLYWAISCWLHGVIVNTSFLPFPLFFLPCSPSICGCNVDPAKDIRQRISQNSGFSSESEQPTCIQTGLRQGAELALALLCRLERELRAVLAAEAGGEVSAGWARHKSNRDQHVLVTIQTDAWHQGGSKLEPPNRWAEHCSESQTGQGLQYQRCRIWKEWEHGLLVSFPPPLTVITDKVLNLPEPQFQIMLPMLFLKEEMKYYI